jgi:hypothetical protein
MDHATKVMFKKNSTQRFFNKALLCLLAKREKRRLKFAKRADDGVEEIEVTDGSRNNNTEMALCLLFIMYTNCVW